jgi:RNA polymerase sigma factor (sigma-70 family)
MSDVTRILASIDAGDPKAAELLLPLVYDELRKLAAARLAHEKPGQTLQATALVHEAYLRIVGSAARDSRTGAEKIGSSSPSPDPSPQPLASPPAFDSRGHFFAAAAEAMRRILVDQARRKASVKHGGQCLRDELPEIAAPAARDADDLLAVDEALTELATQDPLAANLVKLRYFAGLTMDEAAQGLGISSRNAYYTWAYARSWLHKAIAGGTQP